MQTGDPRKKLPLIDNVIAAVDVEGVSGAGFRRLMGEERNGKADVLGGHELAGRRFPCAFSSKEWNSGIPDAARVASGPGEMAWTRIPLGPSSAAM